MPTYEYVCTACASPLEVVAAFTDPPLSVCPECGGRLRKIFGNVGVVFKGSGFYRNDSRSKSGGKAASPAASTEKSGAGSEKVSAEKSSPEKSAGKTGSEKSGASTAKEPSGGSSPSPASKPATSSAS